MKASVPILSLTLFGCIAGTVASQFDFGSAPTPVVQTLALQPLERARPMAPADLPRPPEALRERFRERIKDRVDTDSDGQISDAERQAAREQFQARRDEMRARMIQRFDADESGDLSEAERAEARAAARDFHQVNRFRDHRREQMRRQALERFDADASGDLDKAERAQARAEFEQKRAEFISTFDADGNGHLEGAERDAAREHVRAQRDKRRLDVNNDGSVDERDVQAAANQLAGEQHLPDFNRDGVRDALDVSELMDRVRQQRTD